MRRVSQAEQGSFVSVDKNVMKAKLSTIVGEPAPNASGMKAVEQ